MKLVTLMMNRSEGLVQRRRQPRPEVGQEDRDEVEANHEVNEQDADSKETRLTLMEEVLLLGERQAGPCLLLYYLA